MSFKPKDMDTIVTDLNEKHFDKVVKQVEKLLKDDALTILEISRLKQYAAIAKAAAEKTEIPDEGHAAFVQGLINLGELDRAEAQLQKGDLSDDVALFLKADIAMEREQEEQAADWLKKAIKAAPHNKGYAINAPSFQKVLDAEPFKFLFEESA